MYCHYYCNFCCNLLQLGNIKKLFMAVFFISFHLSNHKFNFMIMITLINLFPWCIQCTFHFFLRWENQEEPHGNLMRKRGLESRLEIRIKIVRQQHNLLNNHAATIYWLQAYKLCLSSQ